MRVNVTDDQIKTAFDAVKGDRSFDESRELYKKGVRPAEMIQALCLRPEILSAFGKFGACVYPGGLLERSVKEYVIVEASRRNQCQFCRDSHVAVCRMVGVSDDALAAVADESSLSDRERLAVEYTGLVMQDANRIPEQFFERLRERFTEPEIVELTFLVGFINMLNMFNNSLQVTYRGEYDQIGAAG